MEEKSEKRDLKKEFYKEIVKEHNYSKWRDNIYKEYSDVKAYSDEQIINEYKYYSIMSNPCNTNNSANLFQYFTTLATIFLGFLSLIMSLLLKVAGEINYEAYGNSLLESITGLFAIACIVWIVQFLCESNREKKLCCNKEILLILEDIIKERNIKVN